MDNYINMRCKRKTPTGLMIGLKYIFVKMLAEPLDELHDNSER